MTVSEMVDRDWTLDRIMREVRRQAFAMVLKQERRLSLRGAKGRAAKRLGIHRNTVTREIWKRQPDTPIEWERDPPLTREEEMIY